MNGLKKTHDKLAGQSLVLNKKYSTNNIRYLVNSRWLYSVGVLFNGVQSHKISEPVLYSSTCYENTYDSDAHVQYV